MTAMDNLFYRKEKRWFDAGAIFRKLMRNKRLVLAIVLGIPLLGYVIFGNRGILQRFRLQSEKEELEAKIRAEEEETKALKAESTALDGDKKAIEKVAREKHNMVKEGERVYKVTPAQ